MNGIFPAVLLALVFLGQDSPKVTVVALGQLDGFLLRQMGRVSCGPYFTSEPTDRQGGGMVYFGFTRGDWRKYDNDPTNDNEVAGFIVGIIRPRRCEECTAPIAEREGNWVNLYISSEQLNLSTCLRHLKPQK